MSWPQVVAFCLGTAAILAAAYGIARVLRDLLQGARRLGRMLDDWLGEPEKLGIPGTGRPGVLARLSSLEDGMAAMKLQLAAVPRLERRVADIERELRGSSEPGRPKLEAGGVGFQAELSPEVTETARLHRTQGVRPYEQRSR